MYDLPFLWDHERSFIETVEGFIEAASEAIPLSEEERARLRADPDFQDDLEFPYWVLLEQTEIFPSTLRRSGFISTMILVESALEMICGHLQFLTQNPISVRELRGSGIIRSAQYIQTTAGFDIASLPEWSEVRRFQEIRNHLMHGNGAILRTRLQRPLADYFHSSEFLDLLPQNPEEEEPTYLVIRIRDGFSLHVIDVLEAWFNAFPALITDAS